MNQLCSRALALAAALYAVAGCGPNNDSAVDAAVVLDAGAVADQHVRPDIPACSVCHGSNLNAAPPLPVSGTSSARTERGVGAHQQHLLSSTWHRRVLCEDCHKVPQKTSDPGHVDSPLPAEVTFSALARSDGSAASWNGVTCSNVYCHGAKSSGHAIGS